MQTPSFSQKLRADYLDKYSIENNSASNTRRKERDTWYSRERMEEKNNQLRRLT